MLAKWTHPQVKFQSPGFLTMCWDTECTADHHKFLREDEVRGPVCYSKMNSPPGEWVRVHSFELLLVALFAWAVEEIMAQEQGWAPSGLRREER